MASFIENTKSTYLFGLLTLFVTVYGPRLSPKLPEPIQKAFSHPAFRGVVMFLVVFLAKHDIRTAIVATVIFLILSHLLHQETLTETFLQKYEKNIENFADAAPNPNSIAGTICAPVQRKENSIPGQKNTSYYDPQCYPKPQYGIFHPKCESEDKCDEEYCWKPAVQQDDTTHYDINRFSVPGDPATGRKFQCKQPDPNDETTACRAVQPLKVIPAICSNDNNKPNLSNSSNNVDDANCTHSLQCQPILTSDGQLSGNDGYEACSGSNQPPVCVRNSGDTTNQGKCVQIDCKGNSQHHYDYSKYTAFMKGLNLDTATEAEHTRYCRQVTNPDASTDNTLDLGNTIINPTSVSAEFKTKTYKPGNISSSTWPYLFINRTSTDQEFYAVPQRWTANQNLFTTANDTAHQGMGCWKDVYDLGTQEQIERNIAAPATNSLIYNPQSGNYQTGYGMMTDSVPQSLKDFD